MLGEIMVAIGLVMVTIGNLLGLGALIGTAVNKIREGKRG